MYAANSQNRTAPVGEGEGRKPNAIGLYDMSGNVFEWVEDCVHDDYQGAPTDGVAWGDAGGGKCGWRVIRGGSWNDLPGNLRSSNRARYPADLRLSYYIGSRLTQEIP
ncbi:MAG: formylglycine-generating enzyme family protein [Nitrospiraceae bacterium]